MKATLLFAFCLLFTTACGASGRGVVRAGGSPADAGKVAVPIFDSHTEWNGKAKQGTYPEMTDDVIVRLLELGYNVIERSYIDKVLAEHKLTATQMFDAQRTAEFGKLVGASTIVIGTYRHTGGEKDESTWIRRRLHLRAVRVSDGAIVFSSSAKCGKSVQGGSCTTEMVVDEAIESLDVSP